MTPQGSRLIVADTVRTADGVLGNAVLVEGDSVVAVGDATELAGRAATEHNYPGVIVPGLRDAHLHPVPYTAAIAGISLKEAVDIAEVLQQIRSAADSAPGPIVAFRLDDETLADGRLPTRDDLDGAVTSRPVLAHRYCGHVAVANSAALGLADIQTDTPDPPGGVIDRDEAGVPTGVLRETAIELVSTRLAGEAAISPAALLAAFRGMAGLGLTSVGAMVRPGDGPWASLGNEVELLAEVAADLPIRVHAFVITPDPDELLTARDILNGSGERLRWLGVKLFADGSLGGHTAAMYRPFADAPDETGTMRLTAADRRLAETALAADGMVAIHAIGDRACGAVLDLFADLIAAGADPRRLRLEHASVMSPEDCNRAADLGMVVSIQPAFIGSETEWLEKRLGPERLRLAYPFASLEQAGAHLAGGSDCPVEPPHPLRGMALARDRAGLVPEEGLSAPSALRLFTAGAASALGEPPPLTAGSPADLIVLDHDPVASTSKELRDTAVIATLVDGVEVAVDTGHEVWVG
jgi:predicted amidohydrolase YtcJ